MLTSTAPVLPALSDCSLHPRHTRPTGPGTQCPTTQSWFPFHTAVCAHVPAHLGSSRSVFVHAGVDPCAPRAHLAVMVTPRTHCHSTMHARALRVPELCDDHTPPSCLVTNSLAEPRYRSVNTLVLPDPLLTQGGPVTFLARALHQLFVRLCDLAHRGLCCSRVCVCTHRSSLQLLLFCVRFRCFSVSIWTNFRTCGCFLAPQGGITLTTRVFRPQHYTLSNSCVLVRAPRPLCRNRPPHRSPMAQRLQALCLAHRLHTVPSVHRFRRAPPGCHAALLCCIPGALHLCKCSPPHPLPIPTPPLDAATQTIPHIAVSQDVSTQLSLEEFSLRCVHPHNSSGALAPPSTHDVLCPTCSRPVPSLLFDAAVQTPFHSVASHDASTQLPLTEFFMVYLLQ